MPSKGSKAASRQAQLRGKKRRGKGAPNVVEVGPRVPAEGSIPAASSDAMEMPDTSPVGERAAPERRARAARRPRATRETGQTARPSYLGAELRQIGIITAVVLAALAALTFVLGG